MSELLCFLGLPPLLAIYNSGDWSRLATFSGIMAVLYAVVPVVLVSEAVVLIWRRPRSYAWAAICYAINRTVALTVGLSILAWLIGTLQPYQPFTVAGPVGFLYAYLVWELAHYAYHRSCHRCRLLWCLHSVHHAPEDMHLMVGHARHVLEGPYADLVRTSICLMLGVPVPMLLAIMAIDGLWGWAIHVSPDLMPRARVPFLLGPSEHRVHHARNPEYIDRNYCNLLPVWDRLLGTYAPERARPDYGITRRPQTFASMYLGEVGYLIRDVRAAGGIAAKLWVVLGPPLGKRGGYTCR